MKAIRYIIITAGGLLIGNVALMSVIANFNIGLLPVFCFGAMLLAYGIFFEKVRKNKLITSFLCLVLITVLTFGSALFVIGNNDNADYKEETFIVLGCGIRGERVSVGLAKRLNKAAEYYEKNPDVTIIVSGGQGPQEDIPEALAMQRYLIEKGIPKEQIIMEDKSTSTITNFRNSYAIMKEKDMSVSSVVFVTNAYHVYRASYYAKSEGFLEISHLGTDIIWYTVPMNYMREMLAVLKMWVFD